MRWIRAATGDYGLGAGDRQAHHGAADLEAHAAQQGRAGSARDRPILNFDHSGLALDQDHRRKPDAVEKGRRRADPARFETPVGSIVTRMSRSVPSVARYSFVARLTACASSSLFHCEPGVDRCLLASATIRLASTAKPSPPTRPAPMHAPTTRSNTLRKMSPLRNRSLRARENAE